MIIVIIVIIIKLSESPAQCLSVRPELSTYLVNSFSCFLISSNLRFIVHWVPLYSVVVLNHLFLHFRIFFDTYSIWISYEMWRFILQVFLVQFVLRLIIFIWAVAILELDLYWRGFYTKQIWEQIYYAFFLIRRHKNSARKKSNPECYIPSSAPSTL
jgi:hypothetical protein